jgi:hypothetical protein
LTLSADHEPRRSASETEVSRGEPTVSLSRRPKVELVPEVSLTPAPAAPAQPPPVVGGKPPFPLAEPGEYYIGLWSGLPNYGCPYCGYATLDGSGAVEIHILSKIDQGNPKHLVALNTVKET